MFCALLKFIHIKSFFSLQSNKTVQNINIYAYIKIYFCTKFDNLHK